MSLPTTKVVLSSLLLGLSASTGHAYSNAIDHPSPSLSACLPWGADKPSAVAPSCTDFINHYYSRVADKRLQRLERPARDVEGFSAFQQRALKTRLGAE